MASGLAGQAAALFEENTVAFKVLASGQALINTFSAATAALAPPPIGAGPIFGPIAAGVAIASGLKNVAEINKVKLADGVISLDGPGSETSDSIPAMLSRGESVMTAKETRMFKPQLVAIRKAARNKYANGVIGLNDGGIGQRLASQSVYSEFNNYQNQVKANQQLPEYVVSIVDVQKAGQRKLRVTDLSNI
jgi:hypothetical protein